MPIKLYNLGSKGVNVDIDPILLDDQELPKAQNAIQDPIGVMGGIRKRPGLATINKSTAAGAILGGIGVPIADQSSGGTHMLFIGRGTTV